MVTQNNNPFVLPGFGQTGDMAQNPLIASMEMMRQAWQGLASAGGANAGAMAAPISVEDLERRISDLRAVENWLRLNLSMLSSTIQGLEVQRSTIATLKSFMTSATAAASAPNGPSPLEVALGMVAPASQGSGSSSAAATGKGNSEPSKDTAESNAAGTTAAAQAWWDMVQKQFDTLAAATTATLQGAEAVKTAAQQAASSVSADSTLGKGRTRAQGATASQSPAPRKAAAKKATTRKRAPAARKP